jgi:L-asparaginase II
MTTHDHHGHHHSHGGCCGHDHDHDHDHGTAEGSAALDGGDGPVLVEVTRGAMVESRHRVLACVVDAQGRVLHQWGDFERLVYARSAIKAFQAIPLVETGAADAFSLSDEELALACSSHSAEPVHVRLVSAWLERIGCTAADLECGSHLPYDEEYAQAMQRAGEAPTAVHNNCSGKHTGFLTVARHMGEPLKGYVRYEHPVQQRILGVMEQMIGYPLGEVPRGVDGCGIPTIGMPLGGIAYGMARIADPSDLPEHRAEAVARLRAAWAKHPYLIGGRNSYDTRLMEAVGSRVLLKAGAEGFMCGVLPELGLGIAVKVEDGASRAAGIAMSGILRHCDLLPGADWAALDAHARTVLTNRAGTAVGEVRPVGEAAD